MWRPASIAMVGFGVYLKMNSRLASSWENVYLDISMSDNNKSPTKTDGQGHLFRIPSPYIHKRHRTMSLTEAASQSPRLEGKIKDFCRQKGHGFITPSDGSETLFVHISDIEGEWVPLSGDEVTYQRVLVPPKNEKYQAMHVKITHLKEGEAHQRWDMPMPMAH